MYFCTVIRKLVDMLRLWETIKVFIKGMIMGMVNVVPISSGTISLVLGVYERFINAINSLRIKNFKLLFNRKFKEFGRRTDFKFLLIIILGILAGMVLTSILLKHTLQRDPYMKYTFAFFVGLILASVVYVMKRIDKVSFKNVVLVVVGAAVSFLLSIKMNPNSDDSFIYLVLCGVVGATGMVVPGVSGSHLMLLMGNYELIVVKGIPALTNPSTFMDGLNILLPFVLGAILSIVLFSHLLSWLMREYRNETLSVLAGFMLGSLPVVYPWKAPSFDKTHFVFSLPNWDKVLLVSVIMAVLGAAAVWMIEVMARHTEKKQAERLQNPTPQRKHHGKKIK